MKSYPVVFLMIDGLLVDRARQRPCDSAPALTTAANPEHKAVAAAWLKHIAVHAASIKENHDLEPTGWQRSTHGMAECRWQISWPENKASAISRRNYTRISSPNRIS